MNPILVLIRRAHRDLLTSAYCAIEAHHIEGAYVRVRLERGRPRVTVWALAGVERGDAAHGIPVEWHVVSPTDLELRVRGVVS